MIKNLLKILVVTSFGIVQGQVTILGSNIQPESVSDNGDVSGSSGSSYFLWRQNSGLQIIGSITNGSPLAGLSAISSNGNKIAATITNPTTSLNEIALYSVPTQNWEFLGSIGGQSGSFTGSSWGISANGENVVGLGWVNAGLAHPVKWNSISGILDIGSSVPNSSARASSVNLNGSVIGGWQDEASGMRMGAVWKNGVQTIIYDTNGIPSLEVSCISDDGIWAVGGMYDGLAYIWSETTGVIKIVHPNADPNTFLGNATGVNADGSRVVGYYRDFGGSPYMGEGFLWTPSAGRIELNQYVQSLGYNNQGVTFSLPLGISSNGKYIIGVGRQNNSIVGFMIQLPDNALSVSDDTVKKISIYPNPTTGILHFKNIDKISRLEIYNEVGQKLPYTSEINKNLIDISKFPKGVYFLKGFFNEHSETIKIIKE